MVNPKICKWPQIYNIETNEKFIILAWILWEYWIVSDDYLLLFIIFDLATSYHVLSYNDTENKSSAFTKLKYWHRTPSINNRFCR